jgi:hypothetical protein
MSEALIGPDAILVERISVQGDLDRSARQMLRVRKGS